MKFSRKKIIGLEIDENCVIATELAKKSRSGYIAKYAFASDVKELLKDSYFKDAEVIVNIPTQLVLTRTFYPPVSLSSKPKELTSFLMHQNLLFKLEDCYWDVFSLDKYLNFTAARKEIVDKYLAQVEELGLKVKGVIHSQIALYNVFRFNNPKKNRFALLNIRNSVSDLLVYESSRIWIYPLPMGKKDILQDIDAQECFCKEVQRLFNSHYLQNPRASETPLCLYLSGQYASFSLISSLKEVLVDFEINVFEPLKKICLIRGSSIDNPEAMALSLGLCLTHSKAANCLNLNLIKKRVRGQERLVWKRLIKGALLFVVILTSALLLYWDAGLSKILKQERLLNKDLQLQVSSLLPQFKNLKEEKQELGKFKGILSKKINEQIYFLEAMAVVSQNKPLMMKMKEFEAKLKDDKVSVSLMVTGVTYEEINDFLSKLKKNKEITEAKVSASTFPGVETESKAMDFKLSFELVVSQ